MKSLVLSLSLSLHAAAFFAQSSFTGKITDETNQPLPYANVVLLSLPDSAFVAGSVSDMNGTFKVQTKRTSGLLLRVSSIGYTTLYHKAEKAELGILQLQPDAQQLGEVIVKGSRPSYTMKGTTLTTHVENTLLSSLGTAVDVLKRIPGLQADDESVSVFGKGTPLIYLDGRLVRDWSELKQLDSKDVAKVELLSNPGAGYDAEVKAVLKIKTVRRAGDGLGGSANAAVGKGEFWSNNQQVNLNYRHKGLDVFGSFYHSWQKRQSEQEDVQTVYNTGKTLTLRGTSEGPFAPDYIQTTGGMNYQFNDNHSAGVRYTYSSSTSASTVSSVFQVEENGMDTDRLDFQNAMDGDGEKHQVNLYYNGMWGKKLSVDFNADWLYGSNSNVQNMQESSRMEESREIRSHSNARNNLYAGKLVFSYPIGQGSLQFGTEISFTNRHNRYINESGILDNAADKITSGNQSVFASYQLPLGKTMLEVGARYEHVAFSYYENQVKQEEQSKKYDNLFPNLSFSFPIKNVDMSIGYASRIRRPDYYSLRSDVQYANRYTYERGNPYLLPEISHEVSLMSGYKFVQFSAFYSYSKDGIYSVARPYAEGSDITVFGMENVSSSQTLSATLSASPKFGMWEPMWGVQVLKQFLEGEYCGQSMDFNRPAVAVELKNQLRLPLDIILSLDMSYYNSYHMGYDKMKSMIWADCGLRKYFLNNTLGVSLQANDIFRSKKNDYITYGQSVTFDKHSFEDSRQVTLRLTYRFNASRSKYKGTGAGTDEMNRL